MQQHIPRPRGRSIGIVLWRLLSAVAATSQYACHDSSIYEYYDARAELEQLECGCHVCSDAGVEEMAQKRADERACAVEYVEDSRKKRKQVEPLYACLLDEVHEHIDCLTERGCAGGTRCYNAFPDFDAHWSRCYADQTRDGVTDAANGFIAIDKCAVERAEGG